MLADSYWSVAVSTTWRHCWRSAARRQAEWTPVLKNWTSRDTVLKHVSRGSPLGLLHPAGKLLIAATTTLWWSSSYDLLARWPKSWSLLMRTNLEAAEHPVVLLTSAFVTWRVYEMRNILLCHHNVKGVYSAWELLGHCPGVTTVQYDGQYINHEETNFCADRDWYLPNTAVKLCHTVASYADSSTDFCHWFHFCAVRFQGKRRTLQIPHLRCIQQQHSRC